ncbi:hypothetical protein DNK47_02345 [Mycoplasma wenyonii]|uniref:Uncharacterized protein n=1 Tax=Mycoplasma wenyonii TaxID=65123 RepID=A0A328PU66_9MOLU|nr:hypothetical protein [Mycoplasma wenyonii]RAO94961.1 hypothetical protein DNK47_02345 [Mycoplasma wenyonii]
MFLSFLGKFSGIALLGGAIAGGISLAKSTSSKETVNREKTVSSEISKTVKLDTLDDYQKNCRVVTSTTTQTDINTYLLVCKALGDVSKNINFFIYKDENNSGKGELKEVKSFKYEVTSSVKVTVTYVGEDNETEIMNGGPNSDLNKLNDVILKDKCEVDWDDYKLHCDLGQSIKNSWYVNEVKKTIYPEQRFG